MGEQLNQQPQVESQWDRQKQWEVQYQERAETDRQGFRGLVLINGGTAVALGALLQALVGRPEATRLLPWVLVGIFLTVLGVAAAAAIFWIVYRQSLLDERGISRQQNPWWHVRWWTQAASLALFVLGLLIVVLGAFLTLNFDP